jgi:outer membrane protein assembly factor BamB
MWVTNFHGATPVVANGILFDATANNLHALDPVTGSLLWQDASFGPIHWQTPMVANGILYQADWNGTLTAYALIGGRSSGSVAVKGGTSTYRFTPAVSGNAAMATCAVDASNQFYNYIYDDSGTYLDSSTGPSNCQLSYFPVTVGRTYSIETVAVTGSGPYVSAWTINSTPIISHAAGSLAGTSTQDVPFMTTAAGNVTLATCGPPGTVFALSLIAYSGY